MAIFRNFFIFLFLLIITPGWALTLSEALTIAASQPALLESQINVEQTSTAANDAGKRGPDAIALETENFSGKLPGLSRSEVTVSFKRDILDQRKTRAQKKLANLAINSAQQDLTNLKREISNRVQAAFHKVIALKSLCQNTQELTQINREMFDATKNRVEAGASPEQEIVIAQLDLDRLDVERNNLEGQLEEAMLNLFREMGAPADLNSEVIGTMSLEIELPEIDELYKRMAAIHPGLRAMEQNSQENKARLEILKAENRPSYNWAAGARSFREDKSHAFVFAIEAELPNASANRGARKAALIEENKIKTAREKIEMEMLTTLQEQVKSFQRSRETALSLRNKIQPNAQKVLEMALDGYRLGETDQVVVLEAQKAYAEVRRESLMASAELYEAIDAIEQLTGVCLVGECH